MPLFACWSIIDYLPMIIGRNYLVNMYFPPILFLLLIVIASIGVSNIRVKTTNSYDSLLESIIAIFGYILAGFLIVQLILPEFEFVAYTDENNLPILDISPILIVYSLIWVFSIAVYTARAEFGKQFRVNFSKDRRLEISLLAAFVIISLGVFMVIMTPILLFFISDNLILFVNFIISKHSINLGYIWLLLVLLHDPEIILPVTRSIRYQLSKGSIPSVLIKFGKNGPEPFYIDHFDFVSELPSEQKTYALKLGAFGMTALGGTNKYTEGSVTLPLTEHRKYSGLLLSSYVNDSKQPDRRLKGVNFVVLVLLIPPHLEYLIMAKSSMSSLFIERMRQISDLHHELSYETYRRILEEILIAGCMKL